MTAQFYTPVFRAPNAEKADAYYRLWGSYLGGMPASERKRQEQAGVIGPRRMVAVGTTILMDNDYDPPTPVTVGTYSDPHGNISRYLI